jgi:hypothetical protein
MRRALVLASLLLASCDSVAAGFFALGTFQREFPASLDPVQIPGFDVKDLLAPGNVEILLEALGYDVEALVQAGADLDDLQSVVVAARHLGDPLPRHDERIRSLLAAFASLYVNGLLTNPEKGIFVSIDLGALFEEPFDYGRLEASIRERAHSVPVGVQVIRRMQTIDEVFISNIELVALVRSGWLASLRVTEIGLRTLLVEEKLRVLSGMGLSGSLYDPERMEGCVEPLQERITGLERIEIAIRSLADDAEWVHILNADVDPAAPICAWGTSLRSPELIDVLAQDQGLDIRVRVRTLLPEAPFLLGGYLWFDSESVNINAGEF